MPSGRVPLTVQLNRSLFPADLITVRTRGKDRLDGFQINEIQADDRLKGHGGGGGRKTQFGPASSIDVFVVIDYPRTVDYLPLERTQFMRVRPGSPGVLQITWEKINDVVRPGKVYVIWTHQDRVVGRAPLIVDGSAAESFSEYLESSVQPVTGALLKIRRRIPRMRMRDIARRIRAEEKELEKMIDPANLVRAKSISIQGFRGFREEAVLHLAQPTGEEGSGLTFVVGANNTGKSTIWESFDAVARKMNFDVSFSEARRNRGTPGGVRIQFARSDGSAYVVESLYENTSETKGEWSPAPPMNRLEIVSVPSRRQFQATFGRGGPSRRDWMTNGSEFTRFRQNDQFTGRLFELHNDVEKKANFDRLMAEVLGEQLQWAIELGDGQNGQAYYLKVTAGDGVNHTSEGLGDGIISLLYILNAIYDSEKDTLVVLDEPELSLHPQLVHRLGGVLARFAKDRQIVVFTHSPKLISWDAIQAGAEIARVFKRASDSMIARASRETIKDLSKARGGWRNPHSLGIDATEALFLDDGVIVVEGQEDAALLPVAFKLAGVTLGGTIFGWGSGGEGNVVKIVRLLKDLGFARVAAVLDNNVPNTVQAIREAYDDVMVAQIPAADIRDKPADPKPEVHGLLDKSGKAINDELQNSARETLSAVADFLSNGRQPPVPVAGSESVATRDPEPVE